MIVMCYVLVRQPITRFSRTHVHAKTCFAHVCVIDAWCMHACGEVHGDVRRFSMHSSAVTFRILTKPVILPQKTGRIRISFLQSLDIYISLIHVFLFELHVIFMLQNKFMCFFYYKEITANVYNFFITY